MIHVGHAPGEPCRVDCDPSMPGERRAACGLTCANTYGGLCELCDSYDGSCSEAEEFNPERAAAIPVPPFMSTDSATRKLMPVATGFASYFPDAMLCGSWVSRVGSEKHCAGVLGWDKSKSADEPDAELRHMLDGFRKLPPDPGLEPLAHLGHLASKLWRAAADLQRACDEARAAYERGEDWRK